MSRTGPKTDESSTVVQFHRLFLNCHWHSLIPIRAPRLTPGMWSWYSWQSFICPLDRPVSWLHIGCAPIMYISECCKNLAPCIPRFLNKTGYSDEIWSPFPIENPSFLNILKVEEIRYCFLVFVEFVLIVSRLMWSDLNEEAWKRYKVDGACLPLRFSN